MLVFHLTIELVPVGAVRNAAWECFVAIMTQSHGRMVLGVHGGQVLEQLVIGRRTVFTAFVMITEQNKLTFHW